MLFKNDVKCVAMSFVHPSPPQKQHITQTAGVCGGKPCIAGSRIRVLDIYLWHERQGQSPDEIVTQFPQLTLADVYAALSYFWDHHAEMLADIQRDEALIAAAMSQYKSKLPPKI